MGSPPTHADMAAPARRAVPTERMRRLLPVPEGRALHDRFTAALDDDLDTSSAVAIARETLRAPLSEDERRWLLLDFDYVLGLDLDRVWAMGTAADDTPAEVRELVEARAIARTHATSPAPMPSATSSPPSVGTSSTARTARRRDRGWRADEGRPDAPFGENEATPGSAVVATAPRSRGDGRSGWPRLDLRRGSRHLPWRPHRGDPRGADCADRGGRRHPPRRGRPARPAVPFRNPALTAKMAVELDEVSGGRLVLGLGCGWHEPEFATTTSRSTTGPAGSRRRSRSSSPASRWPGPI